MRKRHGNTRWYFLLTLVATIVILVVFAAILAEQRLAAARARMQVPESVVRYQRLMAAATTEAPPAASPAEGNAPPLPQDEVDALRAQFAAYEAAAALHARTVNNIPEWTEIGEFPEDPNEWTVAQWEKLESFLADRQDLLAAIRQLAARGGPLYPLDFEKSFEMELPHLQVVRSFTQLLALDTKAQARAGNWEAVVANIAAQYQFADAVAADPILISQLVGIAIDSIAHDTLRDALPPGILSDAQLRTLLGYLESAPDRERGADALATEMRMVSLAFDQIRQGELSFVSVELHPVMAQLLSSTLGQTFVSLDEATYLEIMAPLADLAYRPYYEAAPHLDALEQAANDLPFYKPLTRMLSPALTRVLLNQARHEAMVDLMRLGLLIEQHHAVQGGYPASLDSLGGRFIDPFTGQPYLYLPGDDSFTLYSVGQNLTDDGGVTVDSTHGDIVWRGRALKTQ
jgi:hypothetical protein